MNRQFLFIKSATESIALPVDSFSHAEYTSDTTVSVYFNATRSGKDASVKVVLTVSSGKANDVVTSITSQVASGNSPVMKYDDVKGSYYTKNISGITSITTTEAPTITGADGVDGVDADNSKVLLDVRVDEAVSKGDPLYITGYNSGQSRITVAKADAGDAAKMPSIGLALDDYAINTNGTAITMGSFVDVDTSSFSVGDVLYVANGGGLTATKPVGLRLIQNVGKVGRSNAINGEIVVMAVGRSNDVPNIPNGQAWIGNGIGVATPTTLATVATSGSYNDLSDKPSIPTDTNIGNTDQSLSGARLVDLNGETLEFDVNGGRFDLTDAAHTYIAAESSEISLTGTTLTLNSLVFPSSDGTANQVLQTNGSGTLSFASLPIIVLANISGRYQWAADDDGERILTGSTSYGPFNWYSHNTEPTSSTIRDYSGSEVVGSTSGLMSNYYVLSFGIKNPYTGKKVRLDYDFRIFGSPSVDADTPFGFSIWTANAGTSGTVGNSTYTYRGETSDHLVSTSSTAHYHGSFTTSAAINDDHILVMAEHRDGTGGLNGTTYMYANFAVYMVD